MADLLPRVVFFGTPLLAAGVLEALVSAKFPVVGVVTQPDAVAVGSRGRQPAPVKTAAKRLGLPVLQPSRLASLVPTLGVLSPTVGILFAYGRMLPPEVLAAFPLGILNLHPSLLPRYRGPAPVLQAILDGVASTGVSVIRLDEQLDHGPVVVQRTTPIAGDETAAALLQRLVLLGTRELIAILPRYASGAITPTPQSEEQATYTRLMRREDGRIPWDDPAEAIVRRFRACFPWPGVFTLWHGKRLKLLRLRSAEILPSLPPGTVVSAHRNDLVVVACGQGSVAIEQLQLEGAKPLSAADFLRGHPTLAGSRLT